MNAPIAAIPILDWNGSTFILFYIVALIVAAVWSRSRASRAFDSLGRAGHDLEPSDPYEIAYLAAGPSQVAKLAVVRLIQQGLVSWKSAWITPKIVYQQDGAGGTTAERKILVAARKKGTPGLPVKDIPLLIKEEMRPLEVRLASLGLRPTSEEITKAGFRSVLPLISLIVLGCVKLAIGLGRDKPVLFLVALLVVTAVVAVVMARPTRKLTPAGKKLLDKYRLEHERTRGAADIDDPEWLTLNVALFGTAALAGIPLFEGIQKDLDRQISQQAANQAGGGCSSGCGTSSGCGGGGGCGGCGGD